MTRSLFLDQVQELQAPRSLDEVDTPAVLIDVDVVDRNLQRWQERCGGAGLANRPHIKTHKLVPLAQAQLAGGATGITCQKLSEAEVMADGGIEDIFITFNQLGRHRLERLGALARRTRLSVVADNEVVVEAMGAALENGGAVVEVLVECDTGAGRCGVPSPEAAAELATLIDQQGGLRFGGLMTYPRPGQRPAADAFLAEAKALCERNGQEVRRISTGGTPDMWKPEGLNTATEYRAGTYIYNDRSLVERGTCGIEDCALSVLATVVSRPAEERAITDSGSKALTSDLLGLEGYGMVRELREARVYRIDEEHGYLDLAAVSSRPAIGDRVRIIPNHACVVSNLVERVVLVRGNEVLGAIPVDARGCSW
jgi:D-serine deaminase-like pyridoxal phosphate-dependent protein